MVIDKSNSRHGGHEQARVSRAVRIIKSLAEEDELAFWMALELYLSDVALNRKLLGLMTKTLATLADAVTDIANWTDDDGEANSKPGGEGDW